VPLLKYFDVILKLINDVDKLKEKEELERKQKQNDRLMAEVESGLLINLGKK
jgi:hypothetical protein